MQESAPRTPSLGEALAAIGMIQQQIWQQGAVDSEPNDLNKIRAELTSNTISPEEAIKKAQGILDARQNYH